MPDGVTQASAIFQKKLENELRPVPKTVVKIDDILISGADDEDHLKNLTAVFDILSRLGLTLNKSKCKFFQEEVEYLGFFLDKTGIRTNPEKTKAIINAPASTNLNELQSFLEDVNYYDKFIPDMASIANDLYKLLRKEREWYWGAAQQDAFNKLKDKLTETPLLRLYDNSLPLKLACDASYTELVLYCHIFTQIKQSIQSHTPAEH